MDTDQIVVPILRAINDLREEVRDNKREIREMREENNRRWEENDRRWEENKKQWRENNKLWKEYKENRKSDRKELLDILLRYDISISTQLEDKKVGKMKRTLGI